MSRWPDGDLCLEVRRQLEAYLDGDLSASERDRIRSHVDGCPACAAQSLLAQEIGRELRALPELEAPSATVEEILDHTSRARDRRSSLRSWLDIWPRAAWPALAAAALALALGLGILHQRSAEPPPPDAIAIAQATAEARYALAKAGLLTRRAGVAVRDEALRDQVALPVSRGIARAFDRGDQPDSGFLPKGVDDV